MSPSVSWRSIDILLVEDNPGDVKLTEVALREGKVKNKLYVARDGVEAMEFLRKEGPFMGVPMPDLILLDLNMPRKSGQEVLEEIKSDEVLRVIPTVILTTSKSEEDIAAAYCRHANCFITKPVDFNSFIEVVKTIEEFWLTVVKLPTGMVK